MRGHIIALAAAACIATTGCSSADSMDTPASTEETTTSVNATVPVPSESTAEEASTRTSETPGTRGTTEPAGTQSTGEDVDLTTQTFTISRQQAINLDFPMTWEIARDKALGAVRGRITGWKLKWDNTSTSYAFDIENSTGDEVELEINVQTGAVSIDD